MSAPPPYYGPQQPPQPYPPQQYPPEQYQQYPPGQQAQVYGPPPPLSKKKLGIILGAIIAIIVVIVVVLAVLMVGSKPKNMTATQVLDDYDMANFNYRSFNAGDTITLRDKIASINQFGGITTITFEYKGEDAVWKLSDLTVSITGDIGNCEDNDHITIKAKVTSAAGLEFQPQALSWQVVDISECGSNA